MNYKIAVASSNGNHVDLSFGECEEFYIYEVNDDDTFTKIESRNCKNDHIKAEDVAAVLQPKCGCGGNGLGCSTVHTKKVETLLDCKCILCIRAGEKVKKLFSQKAITLFEIEGDIDPLIEKIILYYARAKR